MPISAGNQMKPIPLQLTGGTWRMLGRLVAVLSYYRLTRGERALTLSDTIGTLVTAAVVEIAEDTNRKFAELRKVRTLHELPFFFNADQLAAIEAATSSQIPYAVRIDWARNSGHAQRAARKALRRLAGRPTTSLEEPPRKSGTLRNRRIGFTAETFEWVSQHIEADRPREGLTRPGRHRVQPPRAGGRS